MAASVTMPRVSAVGPEPVHECGRFSCGQERSAYLMRRGSFADGQSRRSVAALCIGRFSTGQETAHAAPGSGREGSFADRMCHIA